MSRRRTGIVNVRMVITEEKILSNIDKVQKLINPKSKKQIVQFEDDTYFKDLIESIKAYLIEYPKKKNFPVNVYKAAYELVEFATNQFEENTKKVEELIRQREENIILSGKLKDLIEAVENKNGDWKERVDKVESEGKFASDVIETLRIVGKSKSKTSQNYQDAVKLLNARVNNLETNLHIEIDMERIEDRSKALSYIGIEVADALKVIPKPIEMEIEEKPVTETKPEKELEIKELEIKETKPTKEIKIPKELKVGKETKIYKEQKLVKENKQVKESVPDEIEEIPEIEIPEIKKQTVSQVVAVDKTEENNDIGQLLDQFEENNKLEEYEQSILFEKKPSLWQRFKKSKFARAVSYIFKIKIRIELPNALPEGRGE